MNKIEIIIVLIVTLIVVLVWVSSDIYFSKPVEDTNAQAVLDPVNSRFDQTTLSQIANNPSAAPTAAPNATNSASLQVATPTPSPSPRVKTSPTPRATASASATLNQ